MQKNKKNIINFQSKKKKKVFYKLITSINL